MKSYQRYVPAAAFGVIASPTCNVVLDAEGSCAIVGALEEVAVWHIKRGVKVRRATAAPHAERAALRASRPARRSHRGCRAAVGGRRRPPWCKGERWMQTPGSSPVWLWPPTARTWRPGTLAVAVARRRPVLHVSS